MTEEHLVQKMSDFVFSQCSPFSEMKKDAFECQIEGEKNQKTQM